MTVTHQQEDKLVSSAQKKRVGIIGAGPGGLACLRAFLRNPERWDITAFESRSDLGGLWFQDPNEVQLKMKEPAGSAVYDSLTTNVPHISMAYNNYPFPPSTPLFPSAATVHQYLSRYATDFNLRPHIRLNTKVLQCYWNGTHWIFKTQHDSKGTEDITFDVALIASGHYSLPLIPDIPGLDSLPEDQVSHSAWYREPSRMADKSVLVVGGRASGLDISREVLKFARETYLCIRGSIRANDSLTKGSKIRGALVAFEYSPNTKTGTAVYEDGTRDEGIEHVILATGYQNDFSMLPQLINETPPGDVDFPGHLYNSGKHIYPLARHMFPIQNDFPPTSLAFISLPFPVFAFPLYEIQAAAAAKVFDDPNCFDLEVEKGRMMEWKRLVVERAGEAGSTGVAKKWHQFQEMEYFDYRAELTELAVETEWKVKPWMMDMWVVNFTLLDEWRELVSEGEAENLVRGAETEDDWAAVVQKMLKRVDERKKDSEVGPSKL